jgi:hypothetical protein
MYRVYVDGAAMVQADLGTIEYAVINDSTKEVITALTSLTVANVVFDTLQTDARWTKDNTGYNFRHDVGHTIMTDPDISYRLEYKVTLSGGSEFWLDSIVVNLNEIYGN